MWFICYTKHFQTSITPRPIKIGSSGTQKNSVIPIKAIKVHKLHQFTNQWLLSVISYILDDGFSSLKPKLHFMFMAFLWSISNICQVNIKIYFHYGIRLSIHVKFAVTGDVFYYLKSDWWPHFCAVWTTEFYCVSPDPDSLPGYETSPRPNGDYMVSSFITYANSIWVHIATVWLPQRTISISGTFGYLYVMTRNGTFQQPFLYT